MATTSHNITGYYAKLRARQRRILDKYVFHRSPYGIGYDGKQTGVKRDYPKMDLDLMVDGIVNHYNISDSDLQELKNIQNEVREHFKKGYL